MADSSIELPISKPIVPKVQYSSSLARVVSEKDLVISNVLAGDKFTVEWKVRNDSKQPWPRVAYIVNLSADLIIRPV